MFSGSEASVDRWESLPEFNRMTVSDVSDSKIAAGSVLGRAIPNMKNLSRLPSRVVSLIETYDLRGDVEGWYMMIPLCWSR